MPFLLTIFFFIWFNNMLGLIPIFPGGANVTGNITVTMVLALVYFCDHNDQREPELLAAYFQYAGGTMVGKIPRSPDASY